MNVIERAARAICRAQGCDPDSFVRHAVEIESHPGLTIDDMQVPHWVKFTPHARAALIAIREPNERMVDRAFDLPPAIEGVDPKAAFTAMIDAALAENP